MGESPTGGPAADPAGRRLLVIGVGPGAVRHVTVEAVEALRTVEVFLVVDKGDAGADLKRARTELLRAHVPDGGYRIVEVPDDRRDPALPYEQAVRAWHLARLERLEAVLADVPPGGTAAILVWGDPSIYDSTLRIVDELHARAVVPFTHDVIAGVSSVQLLAARHRIPLNRIGGSVLVTTGRRVAAGEADEADDVVVMLDASNAFTRFVGLGYELHWGAYLGSDDEVLIAGPLDEVADRVVQARTTARARRGWIFDLYLLRRTGDR